MSKVQERPLRDDSTQEFMEALSRVPEHMATVDQRQTGMTSLTLRYAGSGYVIEYWAEGQQYFAPLPEARRAQITHPPSDKADA